MRLRARGMAAPGENEIYGSQDVFAKGYITSGVGGVSRPSGWGMFFAENHNNILVLAYNYYENRGNKCLC